MSNYYEQNAPRQAEEPTTGPAAQGMNNTANTAAGPQNGTAAEPHAQTTPPPQPGQPNVPPYQTPGGNLGRQIGDSLNNMFSKGDWGELKNLGQAVGDTAREVGKTAMSVGNEVKNEVKNAMPTGQNSPGPAQNNKPQANGYRYGYNYEYKYNYNRNMPQPNGQKQTPPWYGKPVASPSQKPTNYAGVGQIVAGGLGVGFFGILALPFMAAGVVAAPVTLGILALASAGMLGLGINKHDYTKRLLAYQAKLMQTNVMTFPQLAKETGYPEAQIRKDFKKGMRKGILKYVYLDKEGETVMLGDNTYNLYLQAEELHEQKMLEEAQRALMMEENPELAQLEAFREESREVLEKIRAANEAIPGEEISQKLAIMEDTCSKIFAFVETHPAKLPDSRKFMSYYLPTTLKVVDKYREYEEMEIQTPSILKAREEIEQGLDTINEAFSNLLDELYKDDTLDVSTDIEVLHTMLQQEGLTGKKFAIEADPTLKPQ